MPLAASQYRDRLEIKIGCTGWSYRGWSGTFYPKSLKSSDWLKYYSRIFDIAEVNSTFYMIPSQDVARRWNEDTPEGFRFSAKFPSAITHEKRLEDVGPEVFSFLSAMAPLHQKISALVLQLPPSLSFYDAKDRLEELFSLLPDDFVYPIEGRHKSWFSEDAVNYMSKNKRCLVWNEVAGVYNPLPKTSDYLYVRLIGDRSIRDSDFGKVSRDQSELIKLWAKRITTQRASFAMVMVNNHLEGFGPASANTLRKELGMPELLWEEKRQGRLA